MLSGRRPTIPLMTDNLQTPRELVAGDRGVSGCPSSRPVAGMHYVHEHPAQFGHPLDMR
jgi:hypothetical protein